MNYDGYVTNIEITDGRSLQIRDERFNPNVIENLQSAVNQRVKNLSGRKFIFIADSYGVLGWTADVINRTGIDAHALNVGGAGFVGAGGGTTWLQALTTYTTSVDDDYKNSITDIIILGGINDFGIGRTSIMIAIDNFVTYAHNNYPNAMIGCGCLSWAKRDNDISTYITTVIPTYREMFSKYNGYCYYIDKMYVPMHNYSVMATDGIHPTTEGVNDIVDYIIGWLLTGRPGYVRDIQPTLAAETGVTLSGGSINTKLTTDGVCLSMSNLAITFSTAQSLNGSLIKIGSLNGGAVAGYYSGYNGTDATVIIPATVFINGANITTPGEIHIKNGDVYISCIEISGSDYVTATMLSVHSCNKFIDLLDC